MIQTNYLNKVIIIIIITIIITKILKLTRENHKLTVDVLKSTKIKKCSRKVLKQTLIKNSKKKYSNSK